MTTLDIITRHVARLPEPLQIELLHYALFLEQKFAQTGQAAASTPEERQGMLAQSLEAAAHLNPYQDISDPVAWQREIRRDRLLPGRHETPC